MFQSFFVFTMESTSPDGTWYYLAEDNYWHHGNEASSQDLIWMTLLGGVVLEGEKRPACKGFATYEEASNAAKKAGFKKYSVKLVQLFDVPFNV